MDRVKKRDRSVNFTRVETELLLSLVEPYIKIIENKKGGAISWHDKEKAWVAIEKEFNNTTGGIHRGRKHLKLKYEALKRDTRKKACIIREGRCNEGHGGEVYLTEAEKKVFYMTLKAADGDLSEVEQICALGSTSKMEFVSAEIEFEGFENNVNSEQSDEICESKCLSDFYGKEETEDSQEKPIPKTTNCFNYNGKQKTKGKIDGLIESVSDLVVLKKKILEEEIQEKLLQKKTREEELRHRREMRELENQHMLLKIEILKAELENTRKKNYF